jgi:hypothetical protein
MSFIIGAFKKIKNKGPGKKQACKGLKHACFYPSLSCACFYPSLSPLYFRGPRFFVIRAIIIQQQASCRGSSNKKVRPFLKEP